jgi:hypothetical protein
MRTLSKPTTSVDRSPARRVIYRSRKARWARLAVGVVLCAVTAWILVPVFQDDHAPPAPVALVIRTDANDFFPGSEKTYEGLIYLDVTAKECRNPAKVEGTLVRSQATQAAELAASGGRPPEQAMVTFYGARVRSVKLGLSSPPLFATFVNDTGELGTFDNAGIVVVHNQQLPLIHQNGATTAILNARQWPATNAYLHFVAEVDLVRPASFDSCYLDLPHLLSFEGDDGPTSPYGRAAEGGLHVARRIPHLTNLEFPDFEESIGAGDVRGNMAGRIVDQSTIGKGELAGTGVRFRCRYRTKQPVPAGLDPKLARPFIEPLPPNCSGTPRFQAVDLTSDTTRRLSLGGILGALALTLIVETLFIAEIDRSARAHGASRNASSGDCSSSPAAFTSTSTLVAHYAPWPPTTDA